MTQMWLLICFLLLFEYSHQYPNGRVSIPSHLFQTWWDWKDVVQMWCAFLTVPFVHLDPGVQTCCAQCSGTGVWNVHTLYSFVLQEVNSVCCLWSESLLWPLRYQEGKVLQESVKARTTNCVWIPVVLSTWSDPYLETERDDWALNSSFPWSSLPCWTQLCSPRVHQVTMAVLRDWRMLGGLWFGGHIPHCCRFWA